MSTISNYFKPKAAKIHSNGCTVLKPARPTNEVVEIDDDDNDDEVDGLLSNTKGQSIGYAQSHEANDCVTILIDDDDVATKDMSQASSSNPYFGSTRDGIVGNNCSEKENYDGGEPLECNSVRSQHDMNSNQSDGVNPFAKFAFGRVSSTVLEKSIPKTTLDHHDNITLKEGAQVKDNTKKRKKSTAIGFVPIRELPCSEQKKITAKWHSLVDPSTNNVEDRRFQLLIAARLHARCQESTVRKAMQNLYKSITPFTVHTVAALDPNTISACIQNLQYHNMKAKHAVQAANEILNQFDGMVPEDEHELRMLTGIGPVFADLLSYVNTREIHATTTRCGDGMHLP